MCCFRGEMAEAEGDVDGAADMDLSYAVDVYVGGKNIDLKEAKPRGVARVDYVYKKRQQRRIMLLLTRPLYSLTVGFISRRCEHRIKLRVLLRKLVRQHNWVEASGVLSALLKGTHKEASLLNNRMKYWVAMELLRHVESDAAAYSKEIRHLYNTWMGKIHSWKNKPMKDKHAKLESILSGIAHSTTAMPSVLPSAARVSGSQEVLGLTPDELTQSKKTLNDAREDARSLTRLESESASDPVSNLVIGLTFYEDWYSTLPEEMQLKNLDDSQMPTESETLGCNSEKLEDMQWDAAASVYEAQSNLHYHSETSVVNYKDANGKFDDRLGREASKGNINLPVVPHQQVQRQGFYANSVDTSVENDGFVEDHYGKMQVSSFLNVHGLHTLLPIRFPSSEDMEDILSSYGRSFDDTYKNALKHLHVAFESPPPVSDAALLPLIQLLLLGEQTKDVFDVLDKACNESTSVISLRLRAYLWQCFYANDSDKLATYLEDVLKKDPACRYSLARLVSLHQKGDYAPERLVEMIALHLGATYPDYNIWKEFASCLLKLTHCEEDRVSMCVDGDEANNRRTHAVNLSKIPVMFKRGMSGQSWKHRCKWWLNHHFQICILTSEMSAGDLQLMTYKAACASHLYGKEFAYVTEVDAYLNEQESKDPTLLTSLHLHIQKSIGFYPSFVRRKSSL